MIPAGNCINPPPPTIASTNPAKKAKMHNNNPICQFKARVTQTQVMLEDYMESSLDNIVISNVNNIKTTAKDVIKSNPMALVNIVVKYWY